MRIEHRFPVAAGLLAASLAMLPQAEAQDWEVVPELSMSVESDDNVILDRREGAGQASRTVLEAGATLQNRTPTSTIAIQPRVLADTYFSSGHDALETVDWHFDARGERRGQTVSAGFRSAYARQSALRAELAAAVPENPELDEPIEDIGTGRIDFFDDERRTWRLGGNLDFDVSERNRFRLELDRYDVSFRQSGDRPLAWSPFDSTSFAVAIVRQVDDRNQVSARMFVSQFEAGLTSNETRSVGTEGSFIRPLSEVWTMNLTVGMQRNDYQFVRSGTLEGVDNADTNVTYRVGFRKRAQRSVLNLSFAHTVNPSSSGFLSVRDQVNVYLQHQLRERLSAEFGVLLSKQRTVDNVSRRDDREYARLQLGFEWAINPRLFLNSGYRFTAQRFEREATPRANSNLVFVGMTYRGLSRF